MTAALTVNGGQYTGWKSISVKRSIENLCGSYQLGVADKWAEAARSWPINPGDECSISLFGQTVITGYVDSRDTSFAASQHSFSVSGRDRAADLVDSSAVIGKWHLKNQNCLQIAQALAKPYGVPVRLALGVKMPAPQADFAINPGESSFEALDRICRLSGVLPVSDGMGGILLTTGQPTERATDALVQGVNILSASITNSWEGRFYRYIAGGQHKGSDTLNGKNAAAVKGEAYDELVRPARVLYVRPEGNVTPEIAQRRAQWEASVRAARAVDISVTVQGWQQSSGMLWPVNKLVHLQSSYLGITDSLLITEAEYSLSDTAGTTTTLTLKRPQAFLPEPLANKKGKKKAGVGSNPWEEAKSSSGTGTATNPFKDN